MGFDAGLPLIRNSPDNAPYLPGLLARLTVEGDSGLDRHISIAISSSCGAVSELKSVTHPTTKSANVKPTAHAKNLAEEHPNGRADAGSTTTLRSATTGRIWVVSSVVIPGSKDLRPSALG